MNFAASSHQGAGRGSTGAGMMLSIVAIKGSAIEKPAEDTPANGAAATDAGWPFSPAIVAMEASAEAIW